MLTPRDATGAIADALFSEAGERGAAGVAENSHDAQAPTSQPPSNGDGLQPKQGATSVVAGKVGAASGKAVGATVIASAGVATADAPVAAVGVATAVNGAAFALTLEAGTAATLEVAMTRYANAPTMSLPWDAEPAAKAAKL